MFLIERLPSSSGLRADLTPRQLFGGSGDLVRAALAPRPVAANQLPSNRPTSQLDLARPQSARRRKAG